MEEEENRTLDSDEEFLRYTLKSWMVAAGSLIYA